MTPSAFIFLYENQLFLTFRQRRCLCVRALCIVCVCVSCTHRHTHTHTCVCVCVCVCGCICVISQVYVTSAHASFALLVSSSDIANPVQRDHPLSSDYSLMAPLILVVAL